MKSVSLSDLNKGMDGEVPMEKPYLAGIDSNEDLVKRWRAGEPVFSLELGGLGPGYEQAIQNTAFELVCKYYGEDLPVSQTDWEEFGSELFKEPDHSGHTGASAGAAKRWAYQILKFGYVEMMTKIHNDRENRERIIQVSKGIVRP
jgi:hypothetical protein